MAPFCVRRKTDSTTLQSQRLCFCDLIVAEVSSHTAKMVPVQSHNFFLDQSSRKSLYDLTGTIFAAWVNPYVFLVLQCGNIRMFFALGDFFIAVPTTRDSTELISFSNFCLAEGHAVWVLTVCQCMGGLNRTLGSSGFSGIA